MNSLYSATLPICGEARNQIIQVSSDHCKEPRTIPMILEIERDDDNLLFVRSSVGMEVRQFNRDCPPSIEPLIRFDSL